MPRKPSVPGKKKILKENIHYVHPLLYNDIHPIAIGVAGVGGTGTMVLRELARMNTALTMLGRQGLYVTAYDPDTVQPANLGRQLFGSSDLGRNKAEAIMSRINRTYGTEWVGIPRKFRASLENPTILISCVDSIVERYNMFGNAFMGYKKHDNLGGLLYWIDSGNGQNFGQVIVGTSKKIRQPKSEKFQTIGKLPMPHEIFKNQKDEPNEPSCSLAQALGRQDLMINSMMAQIVCQQVWQMVRNNYLVNRGAYVNLSNLTMRPIRV